MRPTLYCIYKVVKLHCRFTMHVKTTQFDDQLSERIACYVPRPPALSICDICHVCQWVRQCRQRWWSITVPVWVCSV